MKISPKPCEEVTKKVEEVTKKVEEVDEKTIKSKFRAPPVRELPSMEQGGPDPDSSLRHDLLRSTSTLSLSDIDASTQQRLRDANVVQITDGSGRWMKVDEKPDGSINMTPVDTGAFLRSLEDIDEVPDMPGISEMMMEELQIKINVIMKEEALKPSARAMVPFNYETN